jgi:signal peptidase I
MEQKIEPTKPEEKTEEKTQPKTKAQSFWELVRFAIIAFIIVIPVRLFVAEPFIVSGSSMVPTFTNGDYLIVDKISYELGTPKRDDVVVFRYPRDTTKFFIKRIIGLPNETVDIKGNDVTITNGAHTQGFKLDQPFVKNPANNDTHIVLKSDEYFVMGDNRSGSSDSRVWGPVRRSLLTGRAFLRLLPVNKIDVLPGNYKQAEPQ